MIKSTNRKKTCHHTTFITHKVVLQIPMSDMWSSDHLGVTKACDCDWVLWSYDLMVSGVTFVECWPDLGNGDGHTWSQGFLQMLQDGADAGHGPIKRFLGNLGQVGT